MAHLQPYPFGLLVTRMFRELAEQQSIFDLPARKFFLGAGERDFSVRFHGKEASAPLGPAAGPHTQMAQNIVLGWLGGCRIVELKTVQILDELVIPRPCIDMETIGFNVEWSQELRLEQSLEEYVKAVMLIELLRHSGKLDLEPGYDQTIYDMSVGYDLAGIRSPRVQAFITSMLDCGEVVERLRREIPEEYAHLRDIDFPTRLSDSLTLSTFHGCPPDEIERIIEFLLEEYRLSCTIKLNPTLLGKDRVAELLHAQMGYDDLRVPDSAFEKDTRWEQAVAFVDHLDEKARSLDLGLGVKFTNTLIVENFRDFFPATEKVMYMSGQPLHVLAMNLVARFRKQFGDRIPISFSAGIDRNNFPDAVALGLVPITVCSDLLRPGGYGRASGYLASLGQRMARVGAKNVADFCIRAYDHGKAALSRVEMAESVRERCQAALARGVDLGAAAVEIAGAELGRELHARWVSEAILLNTETYVAAATADPRYACHHHKSPRKLGRHLVLFDCITCDKCIPICPNDANFAFDLPQDEIPIVKVQKNGGGFSARTDGTLAVAKKHQIGNFTDFCNECGNCDVFCPEDGGPYQLKPRFFGSRADWLQHARLDGFCLERSRDATNGGSNGSSVTDVMWGRFHGKAYKLVRRGDRVDYSGDGFAVTFEASDPVATMQGSVDAEIEIDLSLYQIMDWLREAVYAGDAASYPALLAGETAARVG